MTTVTPNFGKQELDVTVVRTVDSMTKPWHFQVNIIKLKMEND